LLYGEIIYLRVLDDETREIVEGSAWGKVQVFEFVPQDVPPVPDVFSKRDGSVVRFGIPVLAETKFREFRVRALGEEDALEKRVTHEQS
jgi:hypothetical protein